LFDNHGTDQTPAASDAVEYRLDLTDKSATLVWEYTQVPAVFTDCMGDTERLPDGDTAIGWGEPVSAKGYVSSSITEVSPANQVVFELTFNMPYVSYRAFREKWAGIPDTISTLTYSQN
jgi:hypothetical protein